MKLPNNALQATCETHAPERRRYAGKSPSSYCQGSK